MFNLSVCLAFLFNPSVFFSHVLNRLGCCSICSVPCFPHWAVIGLKDNVALVSYLSNVCLQSVQILWARRPPTCQDCGGMGQRDKRLVSVMRQQKKTMLRGKDAHLFHHDPVHTFSIDWQSLIRWEKLFCSLKRMWIQSNCCDWGVRRFPRFCLSTHFDRTFTVSFEACGATSVWTVYFVVSDCSLFKRTEDEYIPDAESVRQQKDGHLQPQTCSLAQCFQLYTKEEQVTWTIQYRPMQLVLTYLWGTEH